MKLKTLLIVTGIAIHLPLNPSLVDLFLFGLAVYSFYRYYHRGFILE